MVRRHLPTPISEDWTWQLQAVCRGMSSDYFFHPPGERGTERETRIDRAKQICADCPVSQPCLQQALETQETYGIWGGQSEEERLIALNRHRRHRHRTDSNPGDAQPDLGCVDVGGTSRPLTRAARNPGTTDPEDPR